MMTLYFSCLPECTELLIDIFSSTAFLKSLRDGHDKLALTLTLFFIVFYRYFCTLIFPLSLPSPLFHTHCFQLVCDTALFTISPFSPLDPCSPFTPLIPGGPLLPRDPSSPLFPFIPIIPGAPFLPSDPEFPFCPLVPVIPLGPLTPGSPLAPSFPCCPCGPGAPGIPGIPGMPFDPGIPENPWAKMDFWGRKKKNCNLMDVLDVHWYLLVSRISPAVSSETNFDEKLASF